MERKTKVRLEKVQRYGLGMMKKIVGISIGSILIAIAYDALIIPYGLLSGGVSGIALIGNYTLNFPVYWGIFLLNLPVFIWGVKELDKKFMFYSLVGTLILIFGLPIMKPYLPVPPLDLFLVSIFSGIVNGLGTGIILKFGASSGGTDIMSVIMKKKANISVGAFSFAFNMLVILLSLFFFELKIALYTCISMWVSGRVIDYVLEGLDRKKSVIIISDKNEEIAARILRDIHRGVTYLQGEGGYTGENKLVINTVVNNFENAKIKEILSEIDPKAFMYITDAIEVSGRGFTIRK